MMEEDAEQTALVHSLIREVQAIVPIADDILQEQFVRLYIENDPQVHLEVVKLRAGLRTIASTCHMRQRR